MSTRLLPHRAIWRARTPLIGLAALALLAVGCGGGGSSLGAATSGSTGSPAANGSGASGATSAYQQCLADHGVTGGFPGGGGAGGGGRRNGGSGATGGGGSGASGRAGHGSGASGFTGVPGTNADGTPRATIDPATLQAARDACQSLAPADGTGGFPGGGAGAQQFTAYLSCLTDNGVTIPGRDGATGATGAAGAPAAGGTGAPGAPGTQGAPGGPGGRGFGLGAIDRTSAAFVAADAKCKVLLPDGVDPFVGGGRNGPPADSVPTTTVAK